MKKIAACVLALALLVPALPACAETFQIASGATVYEMTLDSVEVVDGQLVATVGGYEGGLPIRNGELTIPFWAYAMKNGSRYDATSAQLTVTGGDAIDFSYTIDCDTLPDEIYLYADGAESDAILIWSASDEPEVELGSPENIFWTEYRLKLTGSTTDTGLIGAVVEPAQGYLLMLSYEEANAEAIPVDMLRDFYDDLILELDGDSIYPDAIRPAIEEMADEPQTAFSLIYYIPDGAVALGDMILFCEGLRYALANPEEVPEPEATAAPEAAADPETALYPEDEAQSPFADEFFEEAVRAAAGVPEGALTDEILASVTALHVDADECGDLLGLALLPNLRELTVYGYTIEDYSPLADIATLERLSADHTSLSDLSVLAGCENLKELTIAVSEVTDLSPLSAHAALETLAVTGCMVSDISALAGHAALKYLDLTACEVSDISPLAGCAGLETLILAENPVEDISPVAQLPNLAVLDLTNCMVSDLTPLLDAVDAGLLVELSGNAEWEMPERPADTMAGVLSYLDDPLYAAAREFLKTGETLGSGSKGDPARGLQTLIRAFGKEIAADGNVGPKTMAALTEIEEMFRMEETDALDLETFDRLLMILLIATDEDAAWETVSDALTGEGLMEDDEIAYYAACAQETIGNYYSAMLRFEDLDYLDSAERAAACVREWPKNGEVYRNPAYGGRKAYLNIKVDGDADYATFIKIYAENGDYVAGAFIGGSASVTVKLPGGNYFINKGTGYDWYGANEAFGDEGDYATLYYEDGSSVTTLKSGYEYTLTFDTSYDDPEADDVGTEDIGREGF